MHVPSPLLDVVPPARCPGCRLPPVVCFCADVPRVVTRTRVVVVRHASELRKTSNTGHIAARALANGLLVDWGVQGAPLDLRGRLGEGAHVLYPGTPSRDVADVRTIVVLDGSWSQVRGMRHRVPPLGELPTLSLPAPAVAPLRIRRGNEPQQLATIEAIAAALELLGEPGPAAQLLGIFAVMAQRMRDLRGFDMPAKARG